MLWRPAAADRFTPGRDVPITTIVFHTTTTSWQAAIDTFQGGARLVSAHYVVDRDIDRIARCVRNTDTAWHAGNWPINQRSIGIERADYGDWWNPGPDAQIERIVALSLDLIATFPTITRFIRHDQATATACPDGLDTPRIIREVTMPFDYAGIEDKVKATVRAIIMGEPALTAYALRQFLTAAKAAEAPKKPRKVTSAAKVRAGHGRG